MFDSVDVVQEQKVRVLVVDAAEHSALVVPNRVPELLVRAELIEWVGVEGEIEKPLGVVAVGESVVDELVEEGRLSDAPPSDEGRNRVVLELAPRPVGSGEVVEVALVAGRQRQRRPPVLPPRVVVAECPNEGVTGVDSHETRNEPERNDCFVRFFVTETSLILVLSTLKRRYLGAE